MLLSISGMLKRSVKLLNHAQPIYIYLGSLFSRNSRARKMLHLLLAGYEDVSSFLNQLKLKRSLRISIVSIYYLAASAA